MENTRSNDRVISLLNDLIEVCKDGQNGFRTAAEGLKDSALRDKCLQYAEQRGQFARELQDEVRQLGGGAETKGSVAGALHRGWIDIKAAVTGKDDDAIIAECERGEDVAKETYEKAVNEYAPAHIAGLIQRQYSEVKAVHDEFSMLQKHAA
jgi:uncharacterized protein (TIGR02284 family)